MDTFPSGGGVGAGLRAALRRGRSVLRRLAAPPGKALVILLYHRIAEPAFDP